MLLVQMAFPIEFFRGFGEPKFPPALKFFSFKIKITRKYEYYRGNIIDFFKILQFQFLEITAKHEY